MFSKVAISFFTVSALVAGVFASPIAEKPIERDIGFHSGRSFNNWGGFQSMSNFDNFYGSDNFDGSLSSQVVVKSETELVCRTERIEIIQQRLVVLREMAKRIITEQICDVETQTFVFEQWFSGLHGFSRDLRHFSGHQVGFDQRIASHFGDIIDENGSCTTNDFGFSGHDVGQNVVVVGGSNWDNSRSFSSVDSAFRSARDASSFYN